MEAGMCSCDFDGECADVFVSKVRKARKPHRCIECDAEIVPGELHEWGKYLLDGEWGEDRTCMTCVRIRRDFCAPVGCLRDELVEHLGFDYVTGEWIDR